MPVITAIAILLIIGGISTLITNVSLREDVREIGPRGNFLIPILNPLLPITYTLVALVISVFIHEAGHGIVARVYGIKVESTGIAFVLFVPIGAFVNLDKNGLEKATLKEKSAVLTAGPLNNMILAAVSMVLLFIVISTLAPIPTQDTGKNGLQIISVTDGSLADNIGLTRGSSILTIAQTEVRSQEDLSRVLRSNIGKQFQIVWTDRQGKQIADTLSIPADADPTKPILGVVALSLDPNVTLELYKRQFAFTFDINRPGPYAPYADLKWTIYTIFRYHGSKIQFKYIWSNISHNCKYPLLALVHQF